MRKILLGLASIALASFIYAQGNISGKVLDDSGNGLPGATVLVKGTQVGAITDGDGSFTLNASEGAILVVSFTGFESVEMAASSDMSVTMKPGTSILAELVITSNVIDVVRGRETPVAVSSISPTEISAKVGNLEFPEIMNRTPGVYATKQSGGYGDSRLSLRGFDQRNTSFLINGQPVNDMENGWVYWSNWAGLTDVASGIQIQRGLGASRLAVPSVGGTVSIFTKAAELQKNTTVAQTIGNDGYMKTTASHSTGKNDSGWASSILLSRWQGDGYAYNTAGQGLTYFGALGYAPEGSSHAFNFSFLGAGQWHHQRSNDISIRDYQNFGKDHKDGIDRRWNTNGGMLDGEEFSMRRNFYNKPLATMNWDWDINENLSLATSLYGSWGRGGGTGPRGRNYYNSELDILPYGDDLTDHYGTDGDGARNSDGFIDFDRLVEINRESTSGYTGALSDYNGKRIGANNYSDDNVNNAVIIRRASMNSHDWLGGISSLNYKSGNFRYSVGVDLRKYKGYHYRVLNDLMGLRGYYSTGNENSEGIIIETLIKAKPFKDTGLNGPKIDYYNIGHVDWTGVNGLIEYSSDLKLTAVLQAGYSNQTYQREDFFNQIGNPLSEKESVPGGYVKGGANYNISNSSNAFFNAGLISRQPNFDAVFPGYANDVNPDLQNEKITSFEVGYGYVSRYLTVNINAYSTSWGDRFISRGADITLSDGVTVVEGTAQFKDIDVQHNGIEVEATYNAMDNLKFRGMLSMGDWKYTKDFTAEYYDDDQNPLGESVTLYMKDAKVGDAAQFTAYISADYRVSIMSFDLSYRHVGGLYADYSIEDSAFEDPDNEGALELPTYGLVDFGAGARFQLFSTNALFRVNINNVLDTVYISESETNIHTESGSETFNGLDVRNSVWFGFGRTWNASLTLNF
ncbi:MAG: TonB-dependent receptor plug domain-containing protein [Cytophagales bacterium]|nr:TonB-dependent receptor plug domain-containing protein [Cytophagales bacterium]